MRRSLLLSAVVLLLASAVTVSRTSAAELTCIGGFPTNWSTFGHSQSISGSEFIAADLAMIFENQYALAKADYNVATQQGVRGLRSITLRWFYTGPSAPIAELGVQLIRGGALVDSWSRVSGPFLGMSEIVTTFFDMPIDYIAVYARYPDSGIAVTHPIGFRVEQLCFFPSQLDPTPTFVFTRTPTATRTFTLTPSQTLTPSETPPNYTPPPTVPTAIPSVVMPTMETGGFVSPAPPGDGCEDLTRPCPLWGLPRVSTLSLPMPSGVPPMDTLTPIPSYTYAFAPGGPGGTGTPTPIPGGGLGDVIPPPLGTLSSDGIDQFSALATETFYGAGTGGGDGVDLRQAGYEIGANVGALFGYARMLANADLGRVGTILSFLLLLIAFNLMLRVLLFIVPILFTIFRLIIDIIHAVVSAIDAVIPF